MSILNNLIKSAKVGEDLDVAEFICLAVDYEEDGTPVCTSGCPKLNIAKGEECPFDGLPIGGQCACADF